MTSDTTPDEPRLDEADDGDESDDAGVGEVGRLMIGGSIQPSGTLGLRLVPPERSGSPRVTSGVGGIPSEEAVGVPAVVNEGEPFAADAPTAVTAEDGQPLPHDRRDVTIGGVPAQATASGFPPGMIDDGAATVALQARRIAAARQRQAAIESARLTTEQDRSHALVQPGDVYGTVTPHPAGLGTPASTIILPTQPLAGAFRIPEAQVDIPWTMVTMEEIVTDTSGLLGETSVAIGQGTIHGFVPVSKHTLRILKAFHEHPDRIVRATSEVAYVALSKVVEALEDAEQGADVTLARRRAFPSARALAILASTLLDLPAEVYFEPEHAAAFKAAKAIALFVWTWSEERD